MLFFPLSYTLKNELTVKIRSFVEKDAAIIQRFNSQIVLESTNTNRYPGQSIPLEAIEKGIITTLEDPRSFHIGAFDGNDLVGVLFFGPHITNHHWYAHNGYFEMVTLKKYWGQGIGRKLLHIQEEFARSNGYTQMGATCRANNSRALGLYESEGYKVSGRILRDAKIDGEYIDSLIIIKILE